MVDDGGPAFPIQASDADGSYLPHPGMSLRDWFAGQALAGMYASDTQEWYCTELELRAEAAYAIADAMLKERGK